MGDNSTAAPPQRPSTAFGIDPSSISLAKVFSACFHCLNKATEYFDKQHHPDKLKLSLLRLRMSRLGEHHQLYREPTPNFSDRADDVAAATELLWEFLSLLDVDVSESDDSLDGEKTTPPSSPSPMTLPRLLKKIDTISMKRWASVGDLPSSRRLQEYEGHVTWSETQYNSAADIIIALERRLGPNGLRDLSIGEQKEIESGEFDPAALRCLLDSAEIFDRWTAHWVPSLLHMLACKTEGMVRVVGLGCNVGARDELMVFEEEEKTGWVHRFRHSISKTKSSG